MSSLVLPLSWLLYLTLPTWLFIRGWPIRASFAMIAAAVLPFVTWLATVSDPWGPGVGIILLVAAGQLCLALIPLAIGIVRVVRRVIRREEAAA